MCALLFTSYTLYEDVRVDFQEGYVFYELSPAFSWFLSDSGFVANKKAKKDNEHERVQF